MLQARDVELLVGDDLLESSILLFQLLQPLGLADLKTSILAAPVVDRVLADSVAPRELGGLRPGFAFLQDFDDLLFGETTLAHGSPSLRILAPIGETAGPGFVEALKVAKA